MKGFRMTTLCLPDDTICSTNRQKVASVTPAALVQISASKSSEANPVSIRFSAQWYPDVPGDDLFLNEESFPGFYVALTREVPLISLIFGGSCGADLSN